MKEAENASAPKSVVFSFLASCCCCCGRVARRRDIAHKIKNVGERLDVIANEKAKFGFELHKTTEELERLRTTSFVDVSRVQGREDEKKKVISKLLSESSQEARQLHVVSIFLMKDESFTVETDVLKSKTTDFSYERARHAIMTVSNWARFPGSIYNARKLRSLLIRSFNDTAISKPLLELLQNLTYLRLFDLSASPIEEIPNLTWCVAVEKLPQKTRKLIRLRHLEIFGSGVAFMPKGIEKLTSLRTLTNFIVGGGGDESGAANLGELGNLSNLKGTLWIEKLRNVGDLSEAVKAEIKKKKYLIGLYLLFNGDETESRVDENDLIEALQPPLDLQVLSISEYRGALLPNWIMSLTKLRWLDVSHCGSFEVLLPFGRLPYLEKLTIGVKTRKLDVGFLGLETAPVTAFPKLKELCIWKMEGLEEWDGIGRIAGEKHTTNKIMPQLQELEVKGCPKLRALPDYILTAPALVELRINECFILTERYEAEKGEDWHKISHIPDIQINYERRKRPMRKS
ncbi:unnamed protein product [Dovyalis caffra]|uniref:R13L1/DRL21-like LRR repeat region domain-containing protein n=1 Tax=Dovyalis caffra TaxID=77055 RepID=A0AAV1RP20_9ROSI|nr:unnamed protein product [Dovyalis caffra]